MRKLYARFNPRSLVSFQLALLLIACLSLTGMGPCKVSESQLDRATKASRVVADRTGDAIAIVQTLWNTGVIKDIKVKDKIADQFLVFSKSGKSFNNLLASLSQQFADGKLPPSVWSNVVTQFNELTALFVQLLQLVPQAAGLADSKPFKLITAAVLAIAQVLIGVAQNRITLPGIEDLKRFIPESSWPALINMPEFQREVAAE